MATRGTGLSRESKHRRSRSPKTAKRKAIKHAMLAARKAKKRS